MAKQNRLRALEGASQARAIVVERTTIHSKQPNHAQRKCCVVELVKNKKKVKAFVPGDGTMNYIAENDQVMITGFHGADIPGVKYQIVKLESVSLPRLIELIETDARVRK